MTFNEQDRYMARGEGVLKQFRRLRKQGENDADCLSKQTIMVNNGFKLSMTITGVPSGGMPSEKR